MAAAQAWSLTLHSQYAMLSLLVKTVTVRNYKTDVVKVPCQPLKTCGRRWTLSLVWDHLEFALMRKTLITNLLGLLAAPELSGVRLVEPVIAQMAFLPALCRLVRVEAVLRVLMLGRNSSSTTCWSWP